MVYRISGNAKHWQKNQSTMSQVPEIGASSILSWAGKQNSLKQCWFNVMLGQRRRRCANNKRTLFQCVVFAGGRGISLCLLCNNSRHVPASTGHWHSVGSILTHRLRRRINIKLTIGERLVFAGVRVDVIGNIFLPLGITENLKWQSAHSLMVENSKMFLFKRSNRLSA